MGRFPENFTAPASASANPNQAGVNSNYANGGDGINMFSNPAGTFAEFRPCILGYDTSCGSNGQIRGMPYWNVDATVSKDIAVWKEGRVGATLLFQFTNLFNHTVLGNGYGLTVTLTRAVVQQHWNPRPPSPDESFATSSKM